MDHLFAYGSLRVDEVLLGVLGRVPEHTPWSLPGWRAARLPGLAYPGLVEAPGRRVEGVLLSGLRDGEWERLDRYETDAYARRTVGEHDDGAVQTYVYLAADRVLADDWDVEVFRRDLLPAFLTAERLR